MSGSHQPFIVVFSDAADCPQCYFYRLRGGGVACMVEVDEEGQLGRPGLLGKEIKQKQLGREAPKWCPLRNGDVIVRPKK